MWVGHLELHWDREAEHKTTADNIYYNIPF